MPDPEGDAPSDGYIVTFPYLARQEYEVRGVVGGLAPWGSPTAIGVRGVAKESGQPWLGLANETPISYLRVAAPMSVKEHEFLHLQRLSVDKRASTGVELYDAILREAEPPDFIVSSSGHEVGIEMTQFAISQRRLAQALFFEVNERLAGQQRHRISHLCGYQIYMWFGSTSDGASLPYKKNDSAAYDAIVESLVAFRPDPNALRVPGGQMPEQAPPGLRPVQSGSNAEYFAGPLLNGVPASPFYAMTGIHTVLGFQSDHLAAKEWEKLRSAVARKDRESNDILAISVGAPDQLGRCYTSEEALADFLLEHPQSLSARHLKSVIMHFWSTGRAVELLGESPRELWPAYLQGWSPAFHAFCQ